MQSTPAGDAVKAAEMTKGLDDITLDEKAAAGFRKIDLNFERSSAVGKMPSNRITRYKEIIRERVGRCGKLHCCLVLRNCRSHPAFGNHCPDP